MPCGPHCSGRLLHVCFSDVIAVQGELIYVIISFDGYPSDCRSKCGVFAQLLLVSACVDSQILFMVNWRSDNEENIRKFCHFFHILSCRLYMF